MPKKKFNKKLYQRMDPKAKAAAIGHLSAMGINASENPDIYGIDVLVHGKDGKLEWAVEVEVKLSWGGGHFPFPTVRVPARKYRLMDAEVPIEMYIFNNDCTQFVMISEDDLQRSGVVVVPNKYVPDGEIFFEMPVHDEMIHQVLDTRDK